MALIHQLFIILPSWNFCLELVNMIDTVRFQLPGIVPPRHRLENNELGLIYSPRNQWKKEWSRYFTDLEGPFETKIRITYYPQDLHRNPADLSLVTCSLPKLVYGNNIEMLMEPVVSLKTLNPIISDFFEMKIDLNQHEMDRVDLCYNHYVGDHVNAIIAKLFKLNYPKRATKPYYPTNGVQFYSKASTLIFYDKESESKDNKARGIIREEASYGDKRSTRSAFGSDNPVFLGNITPEMVERILLRENEKLGLYETVMVDETVALRTLVSVYGSEQGVRLMGYLHSVDLASNQELIDMGISPRTLSRNKKLIKGAGICPALTDQKDLLPPLTVNLTKRHGVASCNSDTKDST
jgi:hypothetical protein